jgi:hypothetical protein
MILTKSYLGGISEHRNFSFSTYSQQEVLNENRQIFKSKSTYDLFLSHSYLDKTLVYTLVNLLNKSGYSAYVDWMVDTQLDRSQVNKSTSETLRMRMKTSRGLAYIATSNTSQSKWCPWELGYEDGRTNGRCAILPILDTPSSIFRGQEYLGLYPYLEYDQVKDSSNYDFWVYV